MTIDVDGIAEKMDDYMDQALASDNLEGLNHYNTKAICLGLAAILSELVSIRQELNKR